MGDMDVRRWARRGGARQWRRQETFRFEGILVAGHSEVDLDSSSEGLGRESYVFGREARGEALQSCHFTDQWRIRVEGMLVHAESLSLTEEIGAALAASAGAAGAQMSATLVYVGPRLEQMRADISAVLPSLASRVAVSCWQGRLVLRLLAAETMAGKADLSRIIGSIRGQHVPRVWQT